jgi:hypothetical protein
VRPALLPEDIEFIGASRDSIVAAAPGLTRWLRRVFWVLGGHLVTTGLLVVYVATNDLRTGNTAPLVVLTVAGITSIGWMTIVNFLLHSNFRWALLAVVVLWTYRPDPGRRRLDREATREVLRLRTKGPSALQRWRWQGAESTRTRAVALPPA